MCAQASHNINPKLRWAREKLSLDCREALRFWKFYTFPQTSFYEQKYKKWKKPRLSSEGYLVPSSVLRPSEQMEHLAWSLQVWVVDMYCFSFFNSFLRSCVNFVYCWIYLSRIQLQHLLNKSHATPSHVWARWWIPGIDGFLFLVGKWLGRRPGTDSLPSPGIGRWE